MLLISGHDLLPSNAMSICNIVGISAELSLVHQEKNIYLPAMAMINLAWFLFSRNCGSKVIFDDVI